MREYELGYVLRPDLSDEKLKETVDKFESIMTENDGAILMSDPLGVQKLAYPIKKSYKGNYFFYNYLNAATVPKEMERLMNIDENVLRYLTVRKGVVKDVEARREALVKLREEKLARERES